MATKFILTAAVLVVWLLSEGCVCETISFESALADSDEIFLGELIKIERISIGIVDNYDGEEVEIYGWKYLFDVSKKWKGDSRRFVTLVDNNTSCDLAFQRFHGEYLVYASYGFNATPMGVSSSGFLNRTELSTWLCSRTTTQFLHYEDNWFESDQLRLDKEFPKPIALSKYPNLLMIILLALAVIVLGFFGMRL